jgi:hypothetical protein
MGIPEAWGCFQRPAAPLLDPPLLFFSFLMVRFNLSHLFSTFLLSSHLAMLQELLCIFLHCAFQVFCTNFACFFRDTTHNPPPPAFLKNHDRHG